MANRGKLIIYKKFIPLFIDGEDTLAYNLVAPLFGEVLELADRHDLGSCAFMACGFDPHLPYFSKLFLGASVLAPYFNIYSL